MSAWWAWRVCVVGVLAVLAWATLGTAQARLAAGWATAAAAPYSSDHRPVVVATPAGDLTTYNLGNAPGPLVRADVLALAARPGLVIVCQEAGDRHAVLAHVPGWRTLQAPRHTRARDHLALLVRRGVHLLQGLRIVALSPRTWVGHRVPGARRTGYAENKWIASVVLRVHGHQLVVGDTHLTPPDSPAARALYARQAARAAAWDARPGHVLLGDFQRGPSYVRLAPLRAVATAHAGLSHGTRRIDMGWTRLAATSWALVTR